LVKQVLDNEQLFARDVHAPHNFQPKPLVAPELPRNEKEKARDNNRDCDDHEDKNAAIVLEGTAFHWFPDRSGIAAHAATISGRGLWAI
jgi:hypothetical protein